MKRNYLILSIFCVLTINIFTAFAERITLLDENFLTQESFNTFSTYSVKGDQNWYFRTTYGAVCSGYSKDQNHENENWLISPSLNLSQVNNVIFTFDHTRGNANVMNVGLENGWYKVFATANYTGNPTTTEWIEIENVNYNVTKAWTFVSSGELLIPELAQSESTCIAFRYMSSDSLSATWEIQNVLIIGERTTTNTNETFKIATWNVEHFGSTCYGPSDETLQMRNVAASILRMDADIICLQEVTQSSEMPTISNLVTILGDEWGGTIVASNSDTCSQNQGLIYKKSKVQYVSAALLSDGISSQGNSYRYNWSGGRYPVLYNVNLIARNNLVPISLVNIHAKAFADENSYIRRTGASIALKQILDGSSYSSKKLILLGDFNDYLIGSSCSTYSDVSPYENFMTDTINYRGLSQNLQATGCNTYPHTIDNIIISNELFDIYETNSVQQESDLYSYISNYCNTTSDHLPVSASFRFELTSGLYEKNTDSYSLLELHPNPVQDYLKIKNSTLPDGTIVEIYDIRGRLVLRPEISAQTVQINNLTSGIYILKAGNIRGRFVKL